MTSLTTVQKNTQMSFKTLTFDAKLAQCREWFGWFTPVWNRFEILDILSNSD